MTRQNKNKIKGLILLLVFSLNTLAGFACSIGVDMGYNKSHHEHDAIHAAQKANKQSDGHLHEHTSATEHHNQQSDNHGSKEDCCTNGVKDFIQLDKSLANSNGLQLPVFLVAFVSGFFLPTQEPSLIDSSIYDAVRRSWRYSDDTDLRIVIQSFQI